MNTLLFKILGNNHFNLGGAKSLFCKFFEDFFDFWSCFKCDVDCFIFLRDILRLVIIYFLLPKYVKVFFGYKENGPESRIEGLIRLTYFFYNLTKLLAPDNFLITHYNLLLACLLVNNLVPLCYQEVILCQEDNIFLLCYNNSFVLIYNVLEPSWIEHKNALNL